MQGGLLRSRAWRCSPLCAVQLALMILEDTAHCVGVRALAWLFAHAFRMEAFRADTQAMLGLVWGCPDWSVELASIQAGSTVVGAGEGWPPRPQKCYR